MSSLFSSSQTVNAIAAAAQDSAEDAAASAASAALFDGPKVDSYAEIATVAASDVPVGGFLRCVENGETYKRVSSGGDLDFSGVLWKILPRPDGSNSALAFGAAGDGSTDDLAAWQRIATSSAEIIDGGGLTYRLTDTVQILRDGVKVRNARFIGPLTGPISTAADAPTFLEFLGSQGASVDLNADAARGTSSVAVTNASGFAVDQWVRLQSNQVLWGASNTAGEIAKIRSISGDTLTFYDQLYLGYTVADSANVSPLNMLKNVDVSNCRIVGDATTNLLAVSFSFCAGVSVQNLHSTDFQYAHIVLKTCADVVVSGGVADRSGPKNGFNYGAVILEGCNGVTVNGYTGRDLRHTVATGGSNGINRHIRGINNFCIDQTDAGLDAHPSTAEVDFSHNFVSLRLGSTKEGIICQGEKFTAIGNRVFNPARHGILHQPIMDYVGARAEFTAIGNDVEYSQPALNASSVGIMAVAEVASSPVGAVVIQGNRISKSPLGVQVFAKNSNVENVAISGNTMRGIDETSVYLLANPGTEIDGAAIVGNICRQDAATKQEAIYLLGNAGGRIKRASVDANIVDQATSGIRALNADGVRIGGTNQISNAGTDVNISGCTDVVDLRVLHGSTTFDPISLAPGEREQTTVAVAGAVPGDLVTSVSHDASQFNGDVEVTGYVTGTGVVQVSFHNKGASARDMASGTLRATVSKAPIA